jgi:peptidoglycan/xylan/chitin deacetylase (PgdA/CDA1 family)
VIRGFPWARVSFALAVAGAAALLVRSLGGRDVPWWALGAVAGVLLASVAAGVFLQGAGLFARPLLAVAPERARDRLALTFDDGPHPVHTRAVLDLLEARGHRGTFFVIGARAAADEALLAEIARRGHGLGNHSWAHAHTTPFLAPARLAADLERAQELLARAAGRAPRWFRAPIGILSPRVAEAAGRARLALVGWTATARDGVAGTTVDAAAARLERAIRPGAILVLHDAAERGGREPIAPAVLKRLLDVLEQRGLRSVTLDELVDGEGSSR